MCCCKEKKMTELQDFMHCFYIYDLKKIYIYKNLNNMFLAIG